jgi:uncharacterized RmlC-like cupin family protein
MTSKNEDHRRIPGHSLPITLDEMKLRIAHYQDLAPDPKAYPDVAAEGRKRGTTYIISPDGMGGEAPITIAHNFHLKINWLETGSRPVTHSHPFAEIFIPLDSRVRYYLGENLDLQFTLEPLDVISVPAGVFRTFENIDQHTGRQLVLYDFGGDPHKGVVVPPDIYEQFYKDWTPPVKAQ